MGLGKRKEQRQDEFWIATQDVVRPEGHPFYQRLNEVLAKRGFDAFVERRCAKIYKSGGRPGIPPGVYFRMLLVGYFEGLGSERGIAWRCSDSLALRRFLGYRLTEQTPEHSSLSVIRQRIDLRTHKQVFRWVLIVRSEGGSGEGQDGGDRRDDTGGQRGDEEPREAGDGTELRSVFEGVGAQGGDRGAEAAGFGEAGLFIARRRPRTRSSSIRTIRRRRSQS